MEKIVAQLTILFEDPFWIGVLEKEINGKYQVCKITFGPEPKDYQVYAFMAKNWNQLEFSPPIHAKSMTKPKVNPKRLQRSIAKELGQIGVSTKAQQSISLQREEKKLESKTFSKEKRKADKEHQFKLRREKIKAKHRGH
jgi:hypothetical protein